MQEILYTSMGPGFLPGFGSGVRIHFMISSGRLLVPTILFSRASMLRCISGGHILRIQYLAHTPLHFIGFSYFLLPFVFLFL